MPVPRARPPERLAEAFRLTVAVLPLWAALAVPSLSIPVDWSFADAARLTFLDFGLAATLGGVALWANTRRSALRIAASIVSGFLVTWHLREVTRAPETLVAFLAWIVLFALAFDAWLRRSAGAASSGGAKRLLAAGLVAAVGVLVVAYPTSETFRHHLLRHQTLIGTPLYYALERPVEETYEEALRSRSAPPRRAPARPDGEAPAPPPGTLPNLVFVLVDTLRADRLRSAEAMRATRAWAEDGFQFDDVVANASWTRPSVASMFTGLRPEEHGAVDPRDQLPADHATLAGELRARGYETAAFVANFGAVGADAGFDRGFDHFLEIDGTTHLTARARELTDRVDDWLRARSSSAPLFLYAHFLDPHDPYFGFAPSQLPATMRAGYDAEVAYFDDEFARFRAAVLASLGPDTLFVFTSDHGESLGEQGLYGHGNSLYPAQADIPAVVVGPGVPRGRSGARLEGRDLRALTLALASSSRPDLAAWGRTHDRPTRFASVYTRLPGGPHRPFYRVTASRRFEDGDLVLLWSAYGDTWELYDRARDPGFRRNLADERPHDVQRLRAEMMDRGTLRGRRVESRASTRTADQLRALGYVE